jgi:ABC-type antimicrobial peptide transport system permease subunit
LENLAEDDYKHINSLRTDIDFIIRGEKYDLSETGEIINQRPLVKAEREEILKRLLEEFGNITLSFELTPVNSDSLKIGEPTTYTVVGIAPESEYGIVYITTAEYNKHWENQFKTFDYCTVMETNYKSDGGTSYSLVYAPFTNTSAQKDMLWNMHENKDFDENSTRVSLGGMYVSELDMIDELVQSLSKVFLYVGIVFAAFAILLFSNFISTSISQKRREIGILRAVGARGTDVFKIFFSESFVIAFICSLISIIGTSLVCSALNTSIAAELGVSLFVFGPFSMLIIIGTALLTAILATFVPVWMAARKKPVESIKSL